MNTENEVINKSNSRLTTESVLPQTINKSDRKVNGYNIYPYHSIGSDKIFKGYASLADWVIQQKNVVIDGNLGVSWDEVERCIATELARKNVKVNWIRMARLMKTECEVQNMILPFLGQADSVWGTKTTLQLSDFFDPDQLSTPMPDKNSEINIAIGIGAGLLDWDTAIVYLDMPKNELHFKMRAGTVTNLGLTEQYNSIEMYKRLYFVDWVVLNEHKNNILPNITIIGDAQWDSSLNWMLKNDFENGLKNLSQSAFRVRPWFEPGAWGGSWMQKRFDGLNKDAVNYAWSFELMVLENGIVFESNGNLLEVSFDFLMYSNAASVLGRDAEIFGYEFPIRFDFLDTFDGDNLSIQCHPSLNYNRAEFGQKLTQDETYYILDCKENAKVYLGFQDDIDPNEFKQVLENSRDNGETVDIEKYVQVHPANKHDLFLIPSGTVHSSGINNMVLEISATPYIFTFKMYDWLNLDLNGKPRPINIEHAFKNLNFERKGERVKNELISKTKSLEKGFDWKIIHYPTHAEHYYDIHRIDFVSQITIETNNVCHVLMLVEGTTISVLTAHGKSSSFSYAETFIIPAAAKSYTLVNTGIGAAKVIKTFVKEDAERLLK